MNRRERESEYWEAVAKTVLGDDFSKISDNVHKRGQVVGKLLCSASWIGQEVLEIGVGASMTAGAIRQAIMGEWNYIGTDMSPHFVKHAQDIGFEAVRTDIKSLPGKDGQFTRVMALDTLEHVNPEDRIEGYAEVARVTAKGGLLLINMPLEEEIHSQHEKEFDHKFGLNNLHEIEESGFQLKSYDRYYSTNTVPKPMAFVVMERK